MRHRTCLHAHPCARHNKQSSRRMGVSELIATLSTNQFFSAGFGLMGVGMGVAAARKWFVLLFLSSLLLLAPLTQHLVAYLCIHSRKSSMQYSLIFARRRFFVSLEIPSKDKSYQWVLEWLSAKGSKYNQHISAETSYQQHESGDVTARVNFIPSVGTHYISYLL